MSCTYLQPIWWWQTLNVASFGLKNNKGCLEKVKLVSCLILKLQHSYFSTFFGCPVQDVRYRTASRCVVFGSRENQCSLKTVYFSLYCGINLNPLSTCRECPNETSGNSSQRCLSDPQEQQCTSLQSTSYFSQVPTSVAAIFKLTTFFITIKCNLPQ